MSYRADRYWWAYVVGGLGMFAFALSMVASSIEQAAFAILIALFSLVFVVLGLAILKSWRTRRQAITGDVWLLPESRIVPETEDVFDVSREPLVLVWRSGPPFLQIVSFGVFCVNVTAVLLMTAAPLIQHIWTPPADSPMGVVLNEAPRDSFMMAVLLWMPVFVVIALKLRNRLVIIEATSDGIRYQPLVGKVRLMRWHYMRLLEVDESKSRTGTMSQSFALYDDQRHVISWLEWGSTLDIVQPEGITWDEMWALSRELVDVIYQRTGLTPRTFTKSLQRGIGVDSEHARWQTEEAGEVGEVGEVDEGPDATT